MKSIALIVDIKGWAFDIAANIIRQELKGLFEVEIFYSRAEEFSVELMNKIKDYDIIHFFWRKTLLKIGDEKFQKELEKNNISIDELKKKTSTGVYDHLFIDEPEYYKIFNDICKKYVVSSQKLYEIYSNNTNIKKPWGVLGDTFETEKFYPVNTQRLKKDKTKPLIIGWAGNSLWNNKAKDEKGNAIDYKGFHTILTPVIEELKKEGYKIETYYADKNTNYIPNDEMNNYYNALDIFICVSITEGTPKPILEAMGCGLPIITTDVGIVKEYMGIKQKDFIIGEREIGKDDEKIRQELKSKILSLYDNRELLLELSYENYDNSKNFNNNAFRDKYINYFTNF